MLLDKATGANGITQEKFITVSVNKKSVEEARNYFTRISADLINHFSQLGSKCIELEAEDRLRLCHDFYRQGEENAFTFDMIQNMKKDIVLKILYALIVLSLKKIILKWVRNMVESFS